MFIVSKLLENISAAPQRRLRCSSPETRDILQWKSHPTLDVILFSVQPTVKAPSQLLGAPLGSDVQLECQVEASPSPVSYWLKGTLNFLEFSSLMLLLQGEFFNFQHSLSVFVLFTPTWFMKIGGRVPPNGFGFVGGLGSEPGQPRPEMLLDGWVEKWKWRGKCVWRFS